MTDKPRRWDDFKRKRRDAPIEQIELDAAAYRFSQTTDGQTLLEWMDVELDIIYPVDAPDGALRELNGARRFRAKLMAHIKRGWEEQTAGRPKQPAG